MVNQNVKIQNYKTAIWISTLHSNWQLVSPVRIKLYFSKKSFDEPSLTCKVIIAHKFSTEPHFPVLLVLTLVQSEHQCLLLIQYSRIDATINNWNLPLCWHLIYFSFLLLQGVDVLLDGAHGWMCRGVRFTGACLLMSLFSPAAFSICITSTFYKCSGVKCIHFQ